MWYVAWYVLAFESPSVHPTITEYERSYIELSAVNMDEVREEKYPKKHSCLQKIHIYLKDLAGHGDGVMYVSY